MEENGNQCEDQHERSIELTSDFLSKYQLIQGTMALLFIPSQVWPGDPTLCPRASPGWLFQSCYPLFTWGKLTILMGIMDSRSLGEER